VVYVQGVCTILMCSNVQQTLAGLQAISVQ